MRRLRVRVREERMDMRSRGFTLIELLIVVAIIGIIAAIAIPNMLNAIERARQKRAIGEVRSLATAFNQYAVDEDHFPVAGTTFAGFNGALYWSIVPDYIRGFTTADPWGGGYGYASTPNGTTFGVGTGASDKAFQSLGPITVYESLGQLQTHCFENDIVWVNDGFVLSPGGKQKKCR